MTWLIHPMTCRLILNRLQKVRLSDNKKTSPWEFRIQMQQKLVLWLILPTSFCQIIGLVSQSKCFSGFFRKLHIFVRNELKLSIGWPNCFSFSSEHTHIYFPISIYWWYFAGEAIPIYNNCGIFKKSELTTSLIGKAMNKGGNNTYQIEYLLSNWLLWWCTLACQIIDSQ